MSDISQAKAASTETFLTALAFNAIVFAIELVAFTALRPYFKAIYEPRTYVPPPSKRIKPMSSAFLAWPVAVWKADYRSIINANGMDAYFFVRFLRMMAKIFLPIWFVSWAVLLPVNSVRTQVGNNSGLDRFTFGNISTENQSRYAAHLVLVYIFTFWIFWNIKLEMRHFILERQKYLISPKHAKSVQANTILITGVPEKYLSKGLLHKMYNELPGGVKKIWINRDLKELPDIYDRRMDACAKLESAETALLRTAAKLRLAELKKRGVTSGKKSSDPEVGSAEDFVPAVPRESRPQHRLGSIPFTGEKVDTIDWAREEIKKCTELLEEGRKVIAKEDEEAEAEDQAVYGAQGSRAAAAKLKEFGGKMKQVVTRKKASEYQYPPLNSVFVTFNKQIAAHLAINSLAHHEPYRMSARYIEVAPADVIWSNLGLNPYEIKVRVAISWAATAALIIFWAIPVAFVGVVSNIHTVCAQASWLAWICTLPKIVVGIISGILPPVLLAVLMMLLPIVLRLLAKLEGIPKRTGLELSLMTRFFIFQVVHSFLIVSLSSGIMAALPGLLNNPTSIPTLLAQNLPLASTFFLTYVILQGLTATAGSFLSAVPLVIYYVKLFILGSTPRSVYDIKYGARSVAWGTTFPGITLLVVIALGYSILSPVINGLACATFFLFYQLYKYLFLWQYQQTPDSDTGGLFFPKAIQHVFAGLYVQQVVLAALFFLAQDGNKHPSAVPQGALMIVLIVFTAFFHTIINNSYDPLLSALPLSLADKSYSASLDTSAVSSVHDPQGDEADVAAGAGAGGEDEGIAESSRGATKPTRHDEESGSDDHDIKDTKDKDAPAPLKTTRHLSEDEYGFAHPAASRPQRIVWIPKDVLGLGEGEVRGCEEVGVDASTADARMDEKGNVDVDGLPPGLVIDE
ncbi:DUF221-domain-containing protein [Pluteus cervinus]|uniref:DUF221-domain-containing protein n=1 Tax=Pluteus cervinus TaxID=181527 RepID=A0ACD3B6Y9_9AGAR|nr:DUF221-domain-containing protein [Pluteus cervinus]